MRIAYLDCFSGISGDMFLAALVDAGAPASLFQQTVVALNAAASLDVRLEIRRVERSGISSTKVDVWVGTEKDQPRTEVSHHHDHSCEYSSCRRFAGGGSGCFSSCDGRHAGRQAEVRGIPLREQGERGA